MYRGWRREFWPTVWIAVAFIAVTVFLNWPLAKTLVAQAMEGLGIAWTSPTQVTDGDKLNILMATLLGLAGVSVAVLAYRISETQHELLLSQKAEQDIVTAKQMEIMRGQHGLLEELKALEAAQADISAKQAAEAERLAGLKPDVRIQWALRIRSEATEYACELWIENTGKRATRRLRYELMLPVFPSGRVFDYELVGKLKEVTTNELAAMPGIVGELHERVSGYLSEPIFPRQKFPLGTVSGKVGRAEPILIHWRIDTDDGPFPADGQYGTFTWFSDEDDIFEQADVPLDNPVDNSGHKP